MARAEIEITLRGGRQEGNVLHYEPGEVLQGSVQVTPDSDINCKHLYARLIWRTEGRGDTDKGKAAELDLFQGQLRAGTPTYHTFHFTLPQEPWSYAGYYINIIWEVEAVVDVPWAVDPKQSQPFVLAPTREV